MRRLNLWFTSVAMVLLLTAIAVVPLSPKGGHKSEDLRILNKTRALIIESVIEMQSSLAAPRRRTFKLILRNGYSQPVVAYSFRQIDASVPSNSFAGLETNGATNGWVLPPNATDATYFSAPAEGAISMTLEAVVLEDGSGEGDLDAISRIREVRAGVRMAYDRIVPLLRQTASSSVNVGSDEAFQSLDREISALSDTGVSPNLRRGFHEGKRFLAMNLTELRTKVSAVHNSEHRAEIAKFTTRFEEILVKLRDSAHR
jgi:hypothetical protein